jgi:hypothetical protein
VDHDEGILMSLRFRRFLTVSATILITTLGFGMAVSGPAAAADAGDCPTNYFCLYHWVEFGGGVTTILPSAHTNQCVNLSDYYYSDGYNVNNTSASYYDKSTVFGGLVMYDWVGCNPGGGQVTITTDVDDDVRDLSHYSYPNWYHRFGSFKFVAY